MNLGARCEQVMDNRMQCGNTALEGSVYCRLHEAIHSAETPQINDGLTDKVVQNHDKPTE